MGRWLARLLTAGYLVHCLSQLTNGNVAGVLFKVGVYLFSTLPRYTKYIFRCVNQGFDMVAT